jgi:hypothetical protein
VYDIQDADRPKAGSLSGFTEQFKADSVGTMPRFLQFWFVGMKKPAFE